MGEQIKIVDLARTLVRLSGKSERDVKIRFTGLREGEKLSEELFYEREEVIPTSCDKIKRTKGPLKDWSELCRQLEELRASMCVDGAAPVRAAFAPSRGTCAPCGTSRSDGRTRNRLRSPA